MERTADDVHREHFHPIREGKASREERESQIEHSYHYDSPSEDFLDMAGVGWQDLAGKTVLSIGGDIGGKFEREAQAHGVNMVTLNAERPTNQTYKNGHSGV